VASHFRLDFNRVEDLAIVDTDDTANHLGDNNHVTEMGFDDCGFLIWGSLLLGFSQLLNETHWTTLKTASEPTACTGMDEFNKLFIAQIQELGELNSTV